jgi:hypothetical protein
MRELLRYRRVTENFPKVIEQEGPRVKFKGMHCAPEPYLEKKGG